MLPIYLLLLITYLKWLTLQEYCFANGNIFDEALITGTDPVVRIVICKFTSLSPTAGADIINCFA